jgi:hypothetical protein
MIPPPDFEFDPIKNHGNASKHDITLATATELWLDPNRHHDRAKIVQGEHRYALIARRHEKIWRCVFTLRAGKLRLISCRRARPKEIARYHRRGT